MISITSCALTSTPCLKAGGGCQTAAPYIVENTVKGDKIWIYEDYQVGMELEMLGRGYHVDYTLVI